MAKVNERMLAQAQRLVDGYLDKVYEPLLRKASWDFNLPMDVIDDEILYTYEGTGLNAPLEVIASIYRVIDSKETQLREAVIAEAEMQGKKDEYIALEQAWTDTKQMYMNEGKFGLNSNEIPEGKAFNDFRNELIDGNETLTQLRQDYWDVRPMLKKDFYEFSADNSNRPCNLPAYIAEVALPEGNVYDGSYWELMRLLTPKWAVATVIFDSKSNGVKPRDEKTRTNGTYCSACYYDKTREGEERFDSLAHKETTTAFFERIRGILMPILRKVEFNPYELDDQDFAGLQKACIDAIAYTDENGEQIISEWRVAYALGSLLKSGELSDEEFGKYTGFDAEGTKSFKENLIHADMMMSLFVKNSEITEFCGRFWNLAWDTTEVAKAHKFDLLKTGMKKTVEDRVLRMFDAVTVEKFLERFEGNVSKARAEATTLLWSKYRRIKNNDKRIPNRLNKFEIMALDENYKSVREQSWEEAINDDSFKKTLLATRNWKFNTGDTTWDAKLTQFRDELKKTVEAEAVIVARTGIDALRKCEDSPEIVKLIAAYKLIAINTEKIVNEFAK